MPRAAVIGAGIDPSGAADALLDGGKSTRGWRDGKVTAIVILTVVVAANPFSYGSPVRAEHFTDREVEVADIADRMLHGQNVVLLSPRRFGKTSLVYAAIDQVRRAGGRAGYANLAQCTDRRDVAEELLRAVLSGPLSWRAARSAELGRLIGRLRLRPEVSVGPDGVLGVHFGPGMVGQTSTELIGEVLGLLSQAGSARRPASMAIDEFQQVAELADVDAGIFKRLADELTGVSLVFSGSRRHVMERLATGPGAPLLGMGEPFALGPVPREEMVGFLMTRSNAAGRAMTEAAAQLVYDLVDGIPNDVQRLAYTAFGLGGGPIDEATVRTAMERAVGHQAADLTALFEGLAPVQKRVLRSLGTRPRAAVYAHEFLVETGVANQNAVTHALRRLGEAELVARQDGVWRVASPFLREWLRAPGRPEQGV